LGRENAGPDIPFKGRAKSKLDNRRFHRLLVSFPELLCILLCGIGGQSAHGLRGRTHSSADRVAHLNQR
jgi:hypothetical protein